MATVELDRARYRLLSARVVGSFRRHAPPTVEILARLTMIHTLQTWPVDTGESARSWKVEALSARPELENFGTVVSITVLNRMPYAVFVEYGTRYIRPGNHVQRAIRQVSRAAPRIVGGMVRKISAEVG